MEGKRRIHNVVASAGKGHMRHRERQILGVELPLLFVATPLRQAALMSILLRAEQGRVGPKAVAATHRLRSHLRLRVGLSVM